MDKHTTRIDQVESRSLHSINYLSPPAMRVRGGNFRSQDRFFRNDGELGEDAIDDVGPFDSGEAEVEALEAIGESLVVDAQQVQHGGMHVMD